MAYNDAGDVTRKDMCPVFGMPGVLPIVLNNSASETNLLVDVPWQNCRLASVQTVVTTAVDTVAAMEIDLELNASGGTEMMTVTVAANSAVGTQDSGTFTTRAACNNLDRDDTSRDKINIEVDGSTTGTGQVMMYMFFEPVNLD